MCTCAHIICVNGIYLILFNNSIAVKVYRCLLSMTIYGAFMSDSDKLHVVWESSSSRARVDILPSHSGVLQLSQFSPLLPHYSSPPPPTRRPDSQHCSQVSAAVLFPRLFTYHSFPSPVKSSASIRFPWRTSRNKYPSFDCSFLRSSYAILHP